MLCRLFSTPPPNDSCLSESSRLNDVMKKMMYATMIPCDNLEAVRRSTRKASDNHWKFFEVQRRKGFPVLTTGSRRPGSCEHNVLGTVEIDAVPDDLRHKTCTGYEVCLYWRRQIQLRRSSTNRQLLNSAVVFGREGYGLTCCTYMPIIVPASILDYISPLS